MGVQIRALRQFELTDDGLSTSCHPTCHTHGYMWATVRWSDDDDDASEGLGLDVDGLAFSHRPDARARTPLEWEALGGAAEALAGRVDEWLRRVRAGGHERSEGQLARTLEQLGHMPSPTQRPDGLSMWVVRSGRSKLKVRIASAEFGWPVLLSSGSADQSGGERHARARIQPRAVPHTGATCTRILGTESIRAGELPRLHLQTC
jgi:hypothetical protein